MPTYEIVIGAYAEGTMVIDAESEAEARQIAEDDGIEISEVSELRDFEIISIKED